MNKWWVRYSDVQTDGQIDKTVDSFLMNRSQSRVGRIGGQKNGIGGQTVRYTSGLKGE